MILITVDAPHFNAGLIVVQGYVVDAAPILRWAVGKPWDEVKAYFARKRWTWEVSDKAPDTLSADNAEP